jgi:hypothetical protein
MAARHSEGAQRAADSEKNSIELQETLHQVSVLPSEALLVNCKHSDFLSAHKSLIVNQIWMGL